MTAATSPAGHAFLSYVHEDSAVVDRLERILAASGIRVWRDTNDLWPGDEWQREIRQAIAEDSLAFIACFSPASAARAKSYQNEELLLAVEQIRLRPPGRSWLVPVRLGECEPPDHDLGAGRTLNGLHRIDLFPDGEWDVQVARLVQTVHRILGDAPTAPPAAPAPASSSAVTVVPLGTRVKAMLRDPARQIELEDEAGAATAAARADLLDLVRFPVDFPPGLGQDEQVAYMVVRCVDYWEAVRPVAELLVAGCAWGLPEQDALWSRTMRSVARAAAEQLSGSSALLDLRRFPALPVLYAGSLAAVARGRYGTVKALAVDARTRNGRGEQPPVVAEAHVWLPFQHAEPAAHALPYVAEGRRAEELVPALRAQSLGRRYTPVSDALAALLRPVLAPLVDDDQEFVDLFDQTEILLGLVATDEQLQAEAKQEYRHGPWFGCFTWRDRYASVTAEAAVHGELAAAGKEWGPLRGGLFGGDRSRAEAAFARFLPATADARSRRF